MFATLLVGCSRSRRPSETAKSNVSVPREAGPAPESTGLDLERPDLQQAAKSGDVETVRRCMALRMSANGGHGLWAPVRAAAREGHEEVVRILLDHGADCGIEVPTMLGDIGEVRKQLAAGQDVDGRTYGGFRPLHWAAMSGQVEMAGFLIEQGADVKSGGGHRGQTPLHVARTVEVARLLVECGADVHASDTNQNTPLHDAGNGDIAELLIERGADVDAQGYYGVTPLFSAVRAGREDCVKLLLEHGADPNRREMYQRRTPLHTVALTHDPEIAALLLGHGAEVNATDRRGNTPLKVLLGYHDFGSHERREATEKVLREYGGVECPHR